MKVLLLAFALFANSFSFAQSNPAKYAEIISENNLQKHLTIIFQPMMIVNSSHRFGPIWLPYCIIRRIKPQRHCT